MRLEPSQVAAVAGGITAFCPGSVNTAPGNDIAINTAQTATIARNALLAITRPCARDRPKPQFDLVMPTVDAVTQRHLDLS